MKLHEEVALAFASALVRKDFAYARTLLTPALRIVLTEEGLRERLTRMYRGYAEGEPCRSALVPEGTLEEWPAKEPGDLGLAYASIEGDDFNEAIYVLVCEADGLPRIREIQWGRP